LTQVPEVRRLICFELREERSVFLEEAVFDSDSVNVLDEQSRPLRTSQILLESVVLNVDLVLVHPLFLLGIRICEG